MAGGNCKYYHMDQDQVQELTKEQYKKKTRSDYDSLKFDITCKKINSFVIKVPDLPTQYLRFFSEKE